jgi:glycosyltransferase involved in cell wall biosynthesis
MDTVQVQHVSREELRRFLRECGGGNETLMESATVRTDRRRPDVLMLGLRAIGQGQGGVEAHVDQLSQEVDREGYSIEAVVRSPYAGSDASERGNATRVVPIWSPKGQSTEAIVHSLLGLLYAAWRRPRVVHVHAVGPSLVVPVARMLGLRVVVTHHGEDYNREKWGRAAKLALRLGETFGARFANERICVSPSLARSLSRRYGKPFRFIPNGVRRMTPVASAGVLDELGLERGNYILHVGRIVPEKRQLDLIAALAGIDRPGLKLVLVGAADHASGYSREVAERADAMPDVVLAGFRSGLALEELFSHAGVFALPSTHEGLPIALLEAMAYGCPVVASDIEANRNLGLPEDCYFKTESVDALREHIVATLDGRTGDGRVDWHALLASYQWPEIAAKTIETYRAAMRDGH